MLRPRRLLTWLLCLALALASGCLRAGFGRQDDGGAPADGPAGKKDGHRAPADGPGGKKDRGNQDLGKNPADQSPAGDGAAGFTVTLLAPPAGWTGPVADVTFSFNAKSASPLVKCTLLLDGKLDMSGPDASPLVRRAIPDGAHTWNVLCEDKAGRKAKAASARSFTSTPIKVTGCKKSGWIKGAKYRLANDIAKASGDCFVIGAEGVWLDGGGRTVISTLRRDVLYARGASRALTALDNNNGSASSSGVLFTDGWKDPNAKKSFGGEPAAADLDGDGDLDLLVPLVSGPFYVYLNDGKGGFGAKHVWSPTGNSYIEPRVLDWNLDGKADLMLASWGNKERFYWGTGGAGLFGGPTLVGMGTYTRHLDLGDFNADGRMDLIASNALPGADDGRRHLVLNLLNGTSKSPTFKDAWISAKSQDSGAWPVYVADFDGDGDLDLLTTRINGTTDRRCRVRLNSGGGSLAASKLTVSYCEALGVANMDKDSDTDLVLALLDAKTGKRKTVAVMRNDGKANFTVDQNIAVPISENVMVAVGDMEGDRFPELVTGARETAGMLTVHGRKAAGAVFVQRWPDKSKFSYRAIQLRDMDADGLLDMMVSRVSGTSQQLVYMKNKGATGFGPAWMSLSSGKDPNYPVRVVGDLHAAPATGVRITAKGGRVTGFAELRGFSIGLDLAGTGVVAQSVVVTDPDRHGLLIRAGGVKARLITVRRLHRGVGLTVRNAANVAVADSVFCATPGSGRQTTLSSYCVGATSLSGKGNRLLLNNGCKGLGYSTCR